MEATKTMTREELILALDNFYQQNNEVSIFQLVEKIETLFKELSLMNLTEASFKRTGPRAFDELTDKFEKILQFTAKLLSEFSEHGPEPKEMFDIFLKTIDVYKELGKENLNYIWPSFTMPQRLFAYLDGAVPKGETFRYHNFLFRLNYERVKLLGKILETEDLFSNWQEAQKTQVEILKKELREIQEKSAHAVVSFIDNYATNVSGFPNKEALCGYLDIEKLETKELQWIADILRSHVLVKALLKRPDNELPFEVFLLKVYGTK